MYVVTAMSSSVPGTAWHISGNFNPNPFTYNTSSDILVTLPTSHLSRHNPLIFHEQESVYHMDSFCYGSLFMVEIPEEVSQNI